LTCALSEAAPPNNEIPSMSRESFRSMGVSS
jgi:hypothetical protein